MLLAPPHGSGVEPSGLNTCAAPMYDSQTRGAVRLAVIGPAIGVPSALPGQFSATKDAQENRSNDFWASPGAGFVAKAASNGSVELIWQGCSVHRGANSWRSITGAGRQWCDQCDHGNRHDAKNHPSTSLGTDEG